MFIPLLFATLAFAHDQGSIPPDQFPGAVRKCEYLLTDASARDGQAAHRILSDALLDSQPDRPIKLEPFLRGAALAEFGLVDLSPDQRKRVRFTAADYEVSLASGEPRSELFRASLDPSVTRHWPVMGRQDPILDHVVTLSAEVGVVWPADMEGSTGARRFFSARYARGGRVIMTLGLDVPCGKADLYGGPNAVQARLRVQHVEMCRIPVLVVNSRLRSE